MNPLPLFLIILTLPLLLGGCGGKEVNSKELEEREGIYYVSGSDTPYTGKSFTLNENGKKASERNFKDGKLDGLYLAWYENGQKESEINFKDGKFDGLETVWWNYGQKASERNFKDGKKEGLHVSWYPNEQKQRETNYKDGKEEGLHVSWHKNGQKLVEVNYKDGEEVEGSRKYWNSKGEPVDSWDEAVAE